MRKNFVYNFLLPSKLLYWSLYGSIGSMLPYFNVFLISNSLTIQQAGIISGVRFFLSGISTILFGVVADRRQNKRKLVIILISIGTLVAILIPSVMYATRRYENVYSLDNNQNDNGYCNYTSQNQILPNQKNYSTNLSYNTTIACRENSTENHYNFNKRSIVLFFAVLVISSTFSITVVPANGLIDALVIQAVSQRNPKAIYGHQRVFAPIGFMMCSFVSALAIEWFNGNMFISKYSAWIFVTVPVNLLTITATYMHSNKKPLQEPTNATSKLGSWLVLLKYCKDIKTIMFLVTVFICGMSNFIAVGYLTVLLEELGTSKTLIGLIVAIASFAEIIAFITINYIKKVFRTKFICLLVAVLSFALRFFLFSILKNPYLFLLAQLLQAFGYGLFWVTAVEYVEQNAPNHIKMTMFNLQQQVYLSFGGIIGNIGGGSIYKHFGGGKLFFISSIICAIWTACLAIYIISDKKKEKQKNNQEKELTSLM